jgi:hypothetical protein
MADDLLEKETIVLKDIEQILAEFRPDQYAARLEKKEAAQQEADKSKAAAQDKASSSEPSEPSESPEIRGEQKSDEESQAQQGTESRGDQPPASA